MSVDEKNEMTSSQHRLPPYWIGAILEMVMKMMNCKVYPLSLTLTLCGTGAGGGEGGKDKLPVLSSDLASFCNLTPANSKAIMERLHRKKVLWQKSDTATTSTVATEAEGAHNQQQSAAPAGSSVWQSTSALFSKDGDGKQTAKFKRLMGIKDDGTDGTTAVTAALVGSTGGVVGENPADQLMKKQEEMFQNMEAQYEVARASTHTHRGIGLGFGIHQYPR